MNILKEVFEQLNIEDSGDKVKKLQEYMSQILFLNESVNLTAIKTEEEFIRKHYVDSLLCVRSREFLGAATVVDVGTGAGFPGVPLAVAFPNKKFILLDSLNKRVKIVNEVCEKLGINNVRGIHGRAEEVARQKDMREAFDICVSRAVANMSTLCEYCMPLVKAGGTFIAYKGPDCSQELEAAGRAIDLLGGKFVRQEGPEDWRIKDLTFDHRLIYIAKVNSTSSKYPRKAGTPSKEPIL
ncbi:MAG: 16S rRNA (guanine(527)-N(7))-methyltransferase RsmG [Clostridiales bacterium]|nr:16S rRNA (guanine(527)-N(7))-methyltransferase RsmG [Clostridiales bacterium]